MPKTENEKVKTIIERVTLNCSGFYPPSEAYSKKKFMLVGRVSTISKRQTQIVFDITDYKKTEWMCTCVNAVLGDVENGDIVAAICNAPEDIKHYVLYMIRNPSAEETRNIKEAVNWINNHNKEKENEVFALRDLRDPVKEDILSQKKAKVYGAPSDSKKAFGALSLSHKEGKRKFELCRGNYPTSTQVRLQELLDSSSIKDHEKARFVLEINTAYESETVTPAQMFACLDEAVLFQTSAKTALCEAMSACKYLNQPRNVLIIGPEGCGKQLLVDTFAKVRKKPILSVPYYSYSSLTEIAGCSSVYNEAEPGHFGKLLHAIGTTDATIIFEGIDRAVHGNEKDGDPDTCLSKILQGLYYDLYLECDVDTSPAFIVATAETEDLVSSAVVSGFDTIIRMDKYTNLERSQIARGCMIPKIMNSM